MEVLILCRAQGHAATSRVVHGTPHPLAGHNLRSGHQINQMLRNSEQFMENSIS